MHFATMRDFVGRLLLFLVSPGNAWSIPWLFVALCLAIAFTLDGRRRPVPVRVLRRAIFPRRIWGGRSARADYLLMLFNLISPALYFGWVLLPLAPLRSLVVRALIVAFGAPFPIQLPAAAAIALSTVVFYLSYEIGYWIDHRLKHRYEVLWRFHAVHHTAEMLTPLTNFRVHPVDTVMFLNVLIVTNGIAGALLLYFFGSHQLAFTIGGTNVIVLAALGLIGTLQHSHFWIVFPSPWNRILLSPAHHQLHHSRDLRHHNSNFGSTLALFDWLFGTLTIPERERPRLAFGVAGIADPHGFKATMLRPFAEASRALPHVAYGPYSPRLARGIRSRQATAAIATDNPYADVRIAGQFF
jgi:sterol desaturase/sphingolipid hydroxylase (fatty acid hydroxylase superfamily)